MKKQWYDHKSRKCPECQFHRPAGERETEIGKTYFPEGCGQYGYSFHEYPEPADDCDGFITPEQYKARQMAEAITKKKTKK